MKISIVTATYNSGKTLGDTLRSILEQTYQDYEVLIIDGGSTDSTREIVEEYMPKFGGRLKWRQGKDKGLYDAMNKGIAMSTGDALGVLNSDDFYASPAVLSAIADGLGAADAVFGDLDFVDAEDTGRVVRRWKGSPYREGAFLKGWHPAHPTFYARKEHYDRFGGFDIAFDVSADFELMLRFIEKARLRTAYLPMVMVKMRMGAKAPARSRRLSKGTGTCSGHSVITGSTCRGSTSLAASLPKPGTWLRINSTYKGERIID